MLERGEITANGKDEDASEDSESSDGARSTERADDSTQAEEENNEGDGNEDTSGDSFIQLKAAKKASRSRDDGDDEDPATMLERGEITANGKDEDASEDSESSDDARSTERADDSTQVEEENNEDEGEEDTPGDSFIQLKAAKKASVSRSPIDGDDDDDDDEFEHGDIIAHAKDEDASDYSMHQFLAADDARGVEGADDGTQAVGENDDDGAEDEVEKSAAEADDNDFDSEDTPDDDSFLQLKATTKAKASRSPIDGDDDDDDDEFEHGDIIAHAKDEDASDYSMHQFLAADDGRGVEGADDGT